MPLYKRGRYSLLSLRVDQPHNIGWCGVGGGVSGVDGLRRQDSGVAPMEVVSLSVGEIVPISGHQRGESRRDGWGLHGGWERPAGRKG